MNRHAPLIHATPLIALLFLAGCARVPDATGSPPASRTGSPAASPSLIGPSVADDWAVLHRPLAIPGQQAGDACPRTPGGQVVDGIGPALGRGPIYPVLGSDGVVAQSETASVEGSLYWKTLWIAAPAYQGPVLIRGRRLDGDAPLRFGANGQYGLEELQLPVRGWATSDGVDPNWRQWPSYTGAAGAGCYGYQIDGLDFTRQVVFEILAGE